MHGMHMSHFHPTLPPCSRRLSGSTRAATCPVVDWSPISQLNRTVNYRPIMTIAMYHLTPSLHYLPLSRLEHTDRTSRLAQGVDGSQPERCCYLITRASLCGWGQGHSNTTAITTCMHLVSSKIQPLLWWIGGHCTVIWYYSISTVEKKAASCMLQSKCDDVHSVWVCDGSCRWSLAAFRDGAVPGWDVVIRCDRPFHGTQLDNWGIIVVFHCFWYLKRHLCSVGVNICRRMWCSFHYIFNFIYFTSLRFILFYNVHSFPHEKSLFSTL